MEVSIFVMAMALVILIGISWAQSDMCREFLEKNEAATKETIRLQQRNYCLESENRALKHKEEIK